ncbi:MAG: hypothetical protein ACK52I_26560 [Pseudomonadota bacterium]
MSQPPASGGEALALALVTVVATLLLYVGSALATLQLRRRAR